MKASARALKAIHSISPSSLVTIPTYLCPSLVGRSRPWLPLSRKQALQGVACAAHQSFRTLYAAGPSSVNTNGEPTSNLAVLPFSCPGCGALTQDLESDNAGFYSMHRKSVKAFIQGRRPKFTNQKEGKDALVDPVPTSIADEAHQELDVHRSGADESMHLRTAFVDRN